MKTLSGSGARGLMVDVMTTYGVDSFQGRLASIIQGSTESTFYVLAVYFGSVNITKTRQALACGLFADAVGVADRDPGTRQIPILLVRVAIDHVVDEVRADPAVVEERVSLGRGAVGDHRPARLPGFDQEPQQDLADIFQRRERVQQDIGQIQLLDRDLERLLRASASWDQAGR